MLDTNVLHILTKLASTKLHENSSCYVQAYGLQDALSRWGGGHDKANRNRLECTKKKKQYTRNKAKMKYNNPSNYV